MIDFPAKRQLIAGVVRNLFVKMNVYTDLKGFVDRERRHIAVAERTKHIEDVGAGKLSTWNSWIYGHAHPKEREKIIAVAKALDVDPDLYILFIVKRKLGPELWTLLVAVLWRLAITSQIETVLEEIKKYPIPLDIENQG